MKITLKMDLMKIKSFFRHKAAKSDDSAPYTIQTQTFLFPGIPMFHSDAPRKALLPTPTDLFIESLSTLSAPQQDFPPEPSIGNWVCVTHAIAK